MTLQSHGDYLALEHHLEVRSGLGLQRGAGIQADRVDFAEEAGRRAVLNDSLYL